MNVHQRLLKSRIDLQEMNISKNGKNQSYSYYELDDILPAINTISYKNGILTRFNIVRDGRNEKAVLTIYDVEEPTNKISFVTPTSEVNLPKGQAIQNLGAKITYLRRYMLMTAFEVVEADAVERMNVENNADLSDQDSEKIKSAKSVEELTRICGDLKKKYKVQLIEPLYKEMKKKLEQDADI